MLFALPIPTDQHKVKVTARVAAKGIDLLIVMLLALPPFLYPLGPLLGFLYSLFGDGMNFWKFEGQSVGKKLMRLQVLRIPQEEPCGFRQAALRNAPVGIATFFAMIPIAGWIILAILGIPLMLMEIYLMLSVDSGHRLGDVMGDTEVVEAKIR